MEPSFKDTQFGFDDSLCEPYELYRNTLVCTAKLMTWAQFENMTFKFKAKINNLSKV